MRIFDKFSKPVLKTNTTKGFYFGSPEAEAENKEGVQNLKYFFDDFLQTLPQLKEGRFMIIGRKGSGKSAIAKFLKDNSSEENHLYCEIVKTNDIELEKIIQLSELNQFENKEDIIFEWTILVKLVKLLLQNKNAQYTNEYKAFQRFYIKNSGVVSIDKFSVTEILKRNSYDISFEPLRHAFKTTIGKYFDYKTVKAPFYKLIPALKDIVSSVLKYDVNCHIDLLILFDDLDIHFKAENEQNKNNLIGLIRTAKNFNNELFKDSQAKVIIFLRDDVKKILEGISSDKTKLFTSYEIPLDWYNHFNFQFDENHTNLKKFINRRIEFNFQANDIEFNKKDPWGSLIINQCKEYGEKTSFKFILDYTFYRPRDFVLFFNNIGKEEFIYPLNALTVKQLLKKYVHENVGELKDELSIYFSQNEIKQLFDFLKTLSYNNWHDYNELEAKISKQAISNCNAEELIRILIDYSLIISKDKSGKMYFVYRERNPFDYFKKEELSFNLHNCLYLFFNPNSI